MAWRGRGLSRLLASSSTAALLIGGGAPAALAACANGAGSGSGFDNPLGATTPCVAVANTSFTGNITNEGTIAPGAITFTSGTMSGIIGSSGNILGGIVIDANSAITAPNGAAMSITGSTFLAGISNRGTITAANGAGIAIGSIVLPVPSSQGVVAVRTFTGGVTNSGTIVTGATGIFVMAAGSFAGGITNAAAGMISAPAGIRVGAITSNGAYTVSKFSGGIVNQGLISGSSAGIAVRGISAFAGGISNSGGITFQGIGISASDVGTFAGGIANSGTISAGPAGIEVCGCVTTFMGGISNGGRIEAFGDGIAVGGVSIFAGGISNSGTIAGRSATGIQVFGAQTFSGGIANSGRITGSSAGIFVGFTQTFGGGISNSGTITAGFGNGIQVFFVDTFSGGISNSGAITVSAGFSKIARGAIVAGEFSSFEGGIANSGTLRGGGITVESGDAFLGGISNSGAIALSGFGGGGKGKFATAGIMVSGVNVFGSASDGGGIANSGSISAPRTGVLVEFVSTFFGGIANIGTISINSGTSRTAIVVRAIDTFSGGIVNAGRIATGISGVAIAVNGIGTFQGGVANTGTIAAGFGGILVGSIGSFGGGISNGGVISLSAPFSGAGISVDNVSLFTGGVHNSGTISAPVGIELGGCGCGISTFSGGVTNSGLIAAGGIGILVANVSSFDGHIVNTGTIIGGNAALDLSGALTATTIDQKAGLITGDIVLSPFGDTLNVTGGKIIGNVTGPGASGTVNFALGSGAFTYDAPFAMGGLGQLNFNSGTVVVDGTIQATTLAVNSGGTAAGTGTLAGALTVMSGGTLMPGDPGMPLGMLTVTGSLAFNAGSVYAVHIAPGAGNSSATAVSGAVTIGGGTVLVTPQFGHYNATAYTIVNAAGGVSGAFASAPVFAGPLAFTGSATVTSAANDVLLNLGDGFVIFSVPGLNQSQQNVLNGINAGIVSGANLPQQFVDLVNLSGPAFGHTLTQLAGENSAGFFPGAFQAGNAFLSLLINPFLDGRVGAGGGFGAAMGFAADDPPPLPQAAPAFASAMPMKATPSPVFVPHYRAWGAGYGGSGRVSGDPIVGSHDTSAHAGAFAAGIDYRASPNTVFGIALAGGGTSWDLTGGMGGGHSDMFQAGAYGAHHWGGAYVSGALSYNFHDVTTNRTLTVAGTDKLEGRFQANGVGARLEGGYRYATPWLGFTPYAAAQVQSIALPGYGETATAGSNQFALNFASQTATTTRTELGAWLDTSRHMDGGALLTLYGRAAWAHDWGNSPSASAIFQALPGSNFIVNGAMPARDGALVTGAAQYSLPSGWAFVAKFDGEFSSTTSIYSGSGMVKKTW